MSDSEQITGAAPVVSALAQPVKPAEQGLFDLDAPTCSEMAQAISASHTAEASQLRENLERRAADQRLRDEMALYDFSGEKYRQFENELARYGMSVLRGWMYTGYIFKLTATRRLFLTPTDAELQELHRDSDAREELATMTVALALPRFRRHALVEGGWRSEGGASLPTYFMGACLFVFPNEFRRRRAQQKRWSRALAQEAIMLAPDAGITVDLESQALGRIRMRDDLRRIGERTRAIVALTLDGYSQEEIAELLGEASVRAVEGALYRWRKSEQQHASEGGISRE
ncbi:RNA polymerase sigma factor [Nonomuraea sp. NPDC003560]|uniref:RNA polymerase sigma factor n=1 Tax=Nonomuraea sp. NPDC003560 TaxID=3364341 RepID=UPI0036BDB556